MGGRRPFLTFLCSVESFRVGYLILPFPVAAYSKGFSGLQAQRKSGI